MDTIENSFFEISSHGNFVKISALARINYNSELDYDNNWIRCLIEVSGGSFNGAYEADIITTTFEIFKQELHKLYDDLRGKAVFSDLEDYIEIEVIGNGSGLLKANVICNDQPGIYSAVLKYEIDFDQTYIKDIVNQLNEITIKFPIRGDFKIKNNFDI